MLVKLGNVKHDLPGHEALTELYAETANCFFEEVDIDLGECKWFDAHMCAPLGAILHSLTSNLNTIRITEIHPSVEKILSKNGFLSSYGRKKIPDEWGTTIPYQHFATKDDRSFATYVGHELMERPELPRMSKGLVKKFTESLFEIFSNAVIHSQTKLGIFCCGQFFPRSYRIDFSVTDLGIGIRENVRVNKGLDLSAEDAIAWATEGQNTTKTGRIPGGLGLKLLKEFVSLNGGSIQIVSDAGYWCLEGTQVSKVALRNPFPGTIVNVEINTADKCSYALSSELTNEDIF